MHHLFEFPVMVNENEETKIEGLQLILVFAVAVMKTSLRKLATFEDLQTEVSLQILISF